MDEQFKNLTPDLDEIEARAYKPRKAQQPIETGPAIVIGAIILVIGLWGGKLFYDHIQEMRAEAALRQLAKSLEASMQHSKIQTQKAMLSNQRKVEQWNAQQDLERRKAAATRQAQIEQANQERREAEAARQAQITQASQERSLQTPECRFWWEQYANDPSARNEAKRKQSCNL